MLLVLPLIMFVGCDSGDDSNGQAGDPPLSGATKKAISTPRVYFFLENTGSMTGYLSANSEFKRCINEVLRNLEMGQCPITTSYINTNVHPSGKGIDGFLRDLTPTGVKVGDQTSSDINKMFELVVDSIRKGGVSILISDGIYSMPGLSSGDPLAVLESEKLRVRNTLVSLMRKRKMSIVVLKFSSKFSGKYYPPVGSPTRIDSERPYYAWLFGDPEKVEMVLQRMKYKEIDGWLEEAKFFNSKSDAIDYHILTTGPEKVGDFVKADMGSGLTHSINDARKSTRTNTKGSFGFAVALNLKSLPLSDVEKLNTSNYIINGPHDDYSIIEVKPFGSMVLPKAVAKKISPTHLVKVSTNGSFLGAYSLRFKKKTPDWIKQTGTDEYAPLPGKTFGFSIVMEGIEMAYQEIDETDFHFDLPININ
jgi:hypothetical protein